MKEQPQNIKLTDLPPPNVLGYLEEDGQSVWDKKFKIRVTSAKTGKKFDWTSKNLKQTLDDPEEIELPVLDKK